MLATKIVNNLAKRTNLVCYPWLRLRRFPSDDPPVNSVPTA
jgi:hypothetical protein